MKKYSTVILAAILVTGMLIASRVDKKLNIDDSDKVKIKREQQHVTLMENGANPSLGETEISEDYIVDESFETHLPIVVIDIADQEIPITKKFEKKNGNSDEEMVSSSDVVVKYTGEDPFVYGDIKIIDNDNYDNHLGDEATDTSKIKIRYRGNSSLNYNKKQYAIKILDNEGNSSKLDVMGMGENNDWILNISMIDQSLIRNYLAYNMGSALFSYTPDAKYCEVVFKTKNGYEYQGLYLMMEKIEKGEDRVDIATYKSGDKYVSYLLCRDRENDNDIQLDTYGNQKNLTYGRLSVIYPREDILDDYAYDYINKDIDKIERVLYSDDEEVFSTWTEYLDKQSFVDYFIFNEMFGNYDAGNNSTYMYKDRYGKLHIGPVWDYDGAMDNYPSELNNPQNVVFGKASWFDRLVKSDEFVTALEERYAELSKDFLSADSIGNYVDEVSAFLGNAAKRDWSRWAEYYGEGSLETKVDQDGYQVDRSRSSYEEEVVRLKDFFEMKEVFIKDGLRQYESGIIQTDRHYGAYGVVLLIAAIICSIVLIGRRKTFR